MLGYDTIKIFPLSINLFMSSGHANANVANPTYNKLQKTKKGLLITTLFKESPSTQNNHIGLKITYLFKIAGFNFSTSPIAAFASSVDTPELVIASLKCLLIASKCGCCKPIPVCVLSMLRPL